MIPFCNHKRGAVQFKMIVVEVTVTYGASGDNGAPVGEDCLVKAVALTDVYVKPSGAEALIE